MSTPAPSPPQRSRRILVWSIVVVLLLFAACVGAIGWYGRNTARSQSEFVTEFAAAQNATVYCGNGAGKDIFGVQDRPWWEWIVLSNGMVDDFTSDLTSELRSRGFEVTTGPGDPSEYVAQPERVESVESEVKNLQRLGYATHWTSVQGATPEGLTIEARIADAMTPRNNCFANSGDYIITPAEPADFDVVAVLEFRDEAHSSR